MAVAGRVYLYGIALVALGMLVSGASGVLALVLEVVVQAVGGVPASIGESQVRSRASLSGALTLIGLVAWVIHWGLAERAARRPGAAGVAERRSAIRKLFLYLVLFLGGLILAFAVSAFLSDSLKAAFGRLTLASLIVGSIFEPFSWLVVVGALEVYYARVASLDRALVPETGAGATLRRWCVYGLAFIGLLMLLFAATGLIQAVWDALVVPPGSASSGGDWLAIAVAPRVGSLVAGLVLWLVTWTWSNRWFALTTDPDPEARSVLRKVYLYLVLAVAVAWTVWNLGRVLYQLLRVVLIPERQALGWGAVAHDLGPSVAAVAVFGVTWLYHARVVRQEAALAGEAGRQASIRWIYEYLVALVGLATLAVGVAGTLATILDLLAQPAAARPTDWWQERVSLFATLIVVGLPIWTIVWSRLQREAAAPAARRSLVRRIYLILVFGLSVLTILGSAAFTFYQLIRVALGERWTAAQTSELITAGSTLLVAVLVLVYHLRAFRGDAGGEEAAAPVVPAPVSALVAVRSSSPEALQAFCEQLRTQAPAGVEVQILDVDAASLERILQEVGRPSPRAGRGGRGSRAAPPLPALGEGDEG